MNCSVISLSKNILTKTKKYEEKLKILSLASARDKHPQSIFNEFKVVRVTPYRESMSMVISQLLLFLLSFID